MCFGGGSAPQQYDAYKSGDFNAWKNAFKTQQDIKMKAAKGEISQADADSQIAAIKNGNPGTTTSVYKDIPAEYDTTTTRRGGREGDDYETKTLKPGTGVKGYVNETVGATPGVDIDSLADKVKGDTAASAEMREMMRQADVALGRESIDQQFKRFNDNYYNDYSQKYKDYYTPQLNDQYNEVMDKTMAALAARGLGSSSVGNNEYAKLGKQKAQATTDISNDAVDAAKKLRGQVESAKGSLYSTNEASANPQAANAQALGQATALVAPPTYSPLGQIFSSALNSLNNYQSAANNAPASNYTSPYVNNKKGSGSVVG